MTPQNFKHRAVHGIFDVGEKLEQRLVAKGHTHAAIHDEDAFAHSREDAAKTQALIGDLAVELLKLTRDFSNLRRGFKIGRVVGREGGEVIITAGDPFQISTNGSPRFEDAKIRKREQGCAQRQRK